MEFLCLCVVCIEYVELSRLDTEIRWKREVVATVLTLIERSRRTCVYAIILRQLYRSL